MDEESPVVVGVAPDDLEKNSLPGGRGGYRSQKRGASGSRVRQSVRYHWHRSQRRRRIFLEVFVMRQQHR